MTIKQSIEEIVGQHCRYCDQSGGKWKLRCKEDVEDQVNQLLSLLEKTCNEERFTKTELEQLYSYCEDREREGWYYGNKKQFENRHESIKKKLKEQRLVLKKGKQI